MLVDDKIILFLSDLLDNNNLFILHKIISKDFDNCKNREELLEDCCEFLILKYGVFNKDMITYLESMLEII